MSNLIQITNGIGTGNTTLYTAFTGGGPAQLLSLDLQNVNASTDVTVDIWFDPNTGTDRYLFKSLLIQAGAHVQWTGLLILNTAGDTIKSIGSATGVDVLGAVRETS